MAALPTAFLPELGVGEGLESWCWVSASVFVTISST